VPVGIVQSSTREDTGVGGLAALGVGIMEKVI
jgi:hypothetical protein